MKKLLIAICLIPILTGCFGPKHLQTKLNKNKYPLGFLHDSPKIEDKLNVTIFLEIEDKSDTIYLTSVFKNDGHFLYLIILYDYDYDFTINLGKNSVKPSLNEFVKQSFIKESERSGKYFVSDTNLLIKYKLLIEILDYNVKSKYHRSGFGLFGYQEWQINIQPSTGNLKLKATLVNMNNEEIFSNDYLVNRTSGFIKSRSESEMEIHNSMMQNMTETLAQCIKENISKIVIDINALLEK